MKKRLKFFPGIFLILLSIVLVSTASYAWFSMNMQVTVKSLTIKAVAEKGITISNLPNGDYEKEAATFKAARADLYPGSTRDLVTWLHSGSTNSSEYNTGNAYTAAVEWQEDTNGVSGNYVLHDFYIRSSEPKTLYCSSLDIKSVKATAAGAAAGHPLSPALRVGIKFDDSNNYYIYAPIDGFTSPVSVQNNVGPYSATDRTNVTAIEGNVRSFDTDITSVPGRNEVGHHVSVYIWYEGEDESCKTENYLVDIVDDIDIMIEFAYTPAVN
ncbi:MAG: hypothetical protein IKN38_06210 [Clostridia bacterium]|nr:hypothetical protein [Clostridia bacterium]